jgi:hypothetical protein
VVEGKEQLLLYFIDNHRFIYFKKEKQSVGKIELSDKPMEKSRIGNYYQFANDTASYFVLMMTMPEVKDSIDFQFGKVILRADEWEENHANRLTFMEANYPMNSRSKGENNVINSSWRNYGIADVAFHPIWYFDAGKAIKITLHGKEVKDIRYDVEGGRNRRIYTFQNGEEFIEDLNGKQKRIFF